MFQFSLLNILLFLLRHFTSFLKSIWTKTFFNTPLWNGKIVLFEYRIQLEYEMIQTLLDHSLEMVGIDVAIDLNITSVILN